MPSDTSSEIRELVARRADLLDELRDGPREKRALVSSLPVSRSTVDRAVTELTSFGLVAEVNGRVRSTAAGDLAASLHRDAVAGLDELLGLASYLDGIDECIRPQPCFFGATDVVTEEDGSHAPAERLIEAFLDADRCRLVRGSIRPAFSADVRERMLDGSLVVDATLCRDSVAFLRSYHESDLARVLGTDHLTVREYPEPLHSGLYLFETDGEVSVSLTIHAETTDSVRALLETDRLEAVAWAERALRAVRERSSPVESV
ncbi:helix-turn-helix transcriptional regulator [Haloplanus litoreus]|uniref:Helix-turn-helix transcriptional regulator n=1 Tax=Haloplanus litoreus TaxID=767515 RepID=A0ABD5ZX77_9EURY